MADRLPEHFRAAVAVGAGHDMGRGAGGQLRPDALVAGQRDVGPDAGFGTYLYFSGTTFFTLGYGDVTTDALGGCWRGRGGLGFVFLAVIISYLPVLYQAFSRREIGISLLDARAGSPPRPASCSAAGRRPQPAGLAPSWSNGSAGRPSCWKAICRSRCWAFTARSTTTSPGSGPDGDPRHFRAADRRRRWARRYQARLTFAMARHAAVDLASVFQTPPAAQANRLPAAELARMRETLRGAGVRCMTRRRGDGDGGTCAGCTSRLSTPWRRTSFSRCRLSKQKSRQWTTGRPAPGCRVRRASSGLSVVGVKDDHFD